MHISKNFIIGVLAVLLVFVSLIILADTLAPEPDNSANTQYESSQVQDTAQDKEAADRAANEKQATESKELLNKCLTGISELTTQALNKNFEGYTSESIAAYQQSVLQAEQNQIMQCQARYGGK